MEQTWELKYPKRVSEERPRNGTNLGKSLKRWGKLYREVAVILALAEKILKNFLNPPLFHGEKRVAGNNKWGCN